MKTILLVEDETIVMRVVSRALQREGFQVLEAPGPKEAIDLAQARKGVFDLLITDVMLPGMSGPALAKRLSPFGAIPVLLTSGYSKERLMEDSLLPENANLICKPFTIDEIVTRVRSILEA